MKVFIPQSCSVIDKLTKEGSGKAEKTDEELKFNILILSEVVKSLISFVERISCYNWPIEHFFYQFVIVWMSKKVF